VRSGFLVLSVVVLLLLLRGFWGQGEEAKRVRAEAARLAHERDSLLHVVRQRNQEKAVLEQDRAFLEAAANRPRDSVSSLERRRADAQLAVRRIRMTGDLQHRLRTTFPELGDSGFGLLVGRTIQ
jgi:hypothetical protein